MRSIPYCARFIRLSRTGILPMKTFVCNFGYGLVCKVEATDSVPPKGQPHIRKVEWSRKPKLKSLRPYVAWMNSVNQQLASEWNVKLMHIFQLSRDWKDHEVWVYEPNKPPKLCQT